VNQVAFDYFTVDGRPKRDMQAQIMRKVFRNKGVRGLIKAEFNFKNILFFAKKAVKGAITYKSLKKESA
jgi:hypothetical protein